MMISVKKYNINYTSDKIQDTYILFTFSVVEEQDHIEPGSCQTVVIICRIYTVSYL